VNPKSSCPSFMFTVHCPLYHRYVSTFLGPLGFPLSFGVGFVVTVSFPLLSYTPKKKNNYNYKHNRELRSPMWHLPQHTILNVVGKVGESWMQDACNYCPWSTASWNLQPCSILGRLGHQKAHTGTNPGAYGQILYLPQTNNTAPKSVTN